ncbi:iron hydrogenase small subunit [Christensenellaceae bacterium NSJ-44]|mgnify:CR=1 FL=1|jgi:NADP-reducing hydrogenase subunit HndD|uniref:Iron hydrogenase small subunit n=1 Tax=Luoshenia tenuis TaxID=2763654 RepID=A0A926CZU4_9FIRM|nr:MULTISPECIES: NADH-dependent [FeFe] hydrogenase, group A6 [Clostridia]MBC8528954.1 iron hydrogenase small subunit [Luoshenia tenuis]SCJ17687.1 Iron hydrogenase 1 [uncultured Clostridium sp.]
MDMINLTIDGVKVQVPAGTTVLNAARQANINIPTLCYLKEVNAIGACRICMVDTGARALSAACVMPVAEGMVVKTNTPKVREARKMNLELLLSNHDRNCLTCVRNQNCELQRLAEEMGVKEIRFEGKRNEYPIDDFSSPSIVRDANKCILCRRCAAVCHNVQKIGVIGATNRGFGTIIEPAFNKNIGEVPCINCGQCIAACPVGALREKDDTDRVWEAIADPDKHVVVQPAPAVRVALGEEFGMPMGTRVTGKMAAALRRLGFDKVFDTNFGADLTIMEEGTELINRLKNGGKLPMITSCSPGWIKYCEHFFPDFLDNLSSCKSPHQMLGAIIKSYYAKQNNIDPAKIFTVSVMPCTAKKFERQRPEMEVEGHEDVDAVITTRELARMIKEAGIDFVNLPDEQFDEVLGDSTGAAAIFGATGGVMEAALRTVYEVVTGKELEDVDFKDVRGIAGVKEAEVDLDGTKVRVAVAHGTGNAKKLLEKVRAGEADYQFIEVMGCPGGCVTGGGQPIVSARVKMDVDPKKVRAAAIYDEDEAMTIRKSHENPSIKKLYEEFLGEPNSHLAHQLLHTHYAARKKYI